MLNENLVYCYHSQNNWIQKIHPYIVIIFFILISIATFIMSSIFLQCLLFMIFICLCLINKENLFSYIRVLWKLKWFFLSIFILYIVSKTSLESSLVALLKMVNIMSYSKFVMENVKTKDILSFLEYFFSPLSIFGINGLEFSFTIALAIQFIPLIIKKVNKIMIACENRGIFYRNLSLKNKIFYIKQCFFPIFIGTMRLSDDLADVMMVRNYHLQREKVENWEFKDSLLLTLLLYFFLWLILWRYTNAI